MVAVITVVHLTLVGNYCNLDVVIRTGKKVFAVTNRPAPEFQRARSHGEGLPVSA